MRLGFLFLGAGTGLKDDLEELLVDLVEAEGLGNATVSLKAAGLLLASLLKRRREEKTSLNVKESLAYYLVTSCYSVTSCHSVTSYY